MLGDRYTCRRQTHAASAVVCTLSCLLCACSNSGPSGNPLGADPYKSRGAAESDPGVSQVAMLEMCDRAAQAIASRIDDVMRNQERRTTKAVIEIGIIENQTRTPASDFELLRRRLCDRLINSDVVRNVAKVMAEPEHMDQQAARFRQAQRDDLLDEGTAQQGAATNRYSAGDTYLLNGYYGESTRAGGAVSQYFFQVTLVNLKTREQVFSEPFDLSQRR